MEEEYNPPEELLGEIDESRALDPDVDPSPEYTPAGALDPFLKLFAGWSRLCQGKIEGYDRVSTHLACRGLSRRSCVCRCHPENR